MVVINVINQKSQNYEKQIVNWFTADTERGKEVNLKPSQTVPDEVLSLNELLHRYARGQSVQVLQPVWNGDEEEFPDLDRMTAQERLDYARELQENIIELKQQQENESKEPSEAEPESGGEDDADLSEDNPSEASRSQTSDNSDKH